MFYSFGHSAQHASPEEIARLEQAEKQMEAALADLDLDITNDLEFHVAMVEATGNRLTLIIFAPLRDAIRLHSIQHQRHRN